MLFLVVLRLAASVFVPFKYSSQPTLEVLPIFDVDYISMKHKVVVFPLKSKAKKLQIEYFERLALVFPDISFIGFTENPMISLHGTTAVVIEDGRALCTFDYMEQEGEFLTFLHNWDVGYEHAKDMAALKTMISVLPVTVIARESNVKDVCKNVSSVMNGDVPWTCQIVTAPPEVFRELKYEKAEVLCYRRDDKVLVDVASVPTLQEAMTPYFTMLDVVVMWHLLRRKKDVVAVITPNKTVQDEKALLKAAQGHPDLAFGFATPYFLALLGDKIGREIRPDERFVIGMSPVDRYTYEPLDIDVNEYAEKLEKGTLKRKYESDPVPATFQGVLVGETYQNYVDRRSRDVVVVYYQSENVDELLALRPTLHKAGVELYVINVTGNSSPLKYPPFMRMPHVQFFPREKSKQTITMLEKVNPVTLMRFVKENCGAPDKVECLRRTVKESFELRAWMKQLNLDEIRPTITKYNSLLDAELGPDIDEIYDEYQANSFTDDDIYDDSDYYDE